MSDATSALPDWITAISTGITAVLTGLAGIAAVAGLRRDTKRQLPIIEPSFDWISDRLVRARILIRNRLPETIEITSVGIKKPRGSKISFGTRQISGEKRQRWEPVPPEFRNINTRLAISPIGSERLATGGVVFDYGESRTCDFYILPPPDWRSGKIVLVLRISSRALTIRDRRSTITRTIAAPANSKPEEMAKSHA